MRRSTADFISYDLRPAKQSERRILLDLLKIAGDSGLPVIDYRYVGMGANRFYDFLMIHKYLGLAQMVSLEREPTMYRRAEFNCPYSFIEVRKESASDFISVDAFDVPTIAWLDYDGGIGREIVDDIASFGTKMKPGDFCFVTVYAGPPGALFRATDAEKFAWFQDELGDLATDVTTEEVENSNFLKAVHKVLVAAFRKAFAFRRDGGFMPFLQVRYADSAPMLTVGGGFLADGQAVGLDRRIKQTLPFLESKDGAPYEIKSLHLTERERVLFDRVTTRRTKRRTSDENKLKLLGFAPAELRAYKELIRYLPRYFETLV